MDVLTESRNRFITGNITIVFSRMDLGSSPDNERLRPNEKKTPQKLALTTTLQGCHKPVMLDSGISEEASASTLKNRGRTEEAAFTLSGRGTLACMVR